MAGLYALNPGKEPRTVLRLIELSAACADDRPVTDITPYAVRSTRLGYWFRAMLHEDEETPSPDRFAYCAFPDGPGAGKWTFIVDESDVIYKKELPKQRGLERYPLDPVKAGW